MDGVLRAVGSRSRARTCKGPEENVFSLLVNVRFTIFLSTASIPTFFGSTIVLFICQHLYFRADLSGSRQRSFPVSQFLFVYQSFPKVLHQSYQLRLVSHPLNLLRPALVCTRFNDCRDRREPTIRKMCFLDFVTRSHYSLCSSLGSFPPRRT